MRAKDPRIHSIMGAIISNFMGSVLARDYFLSTDDTERALEEMKQAINT